MTSRYDFQIEVDYGFCMRVGILGLLILIPMSLHAVDDFDREQTLQRVSPVGKVHIQETVEPSNATMLEPQTEQKIAVKKNCGQATYEQYCVVCHRAGVVGAPKFRNEADWHPRMAKQSIDSLTATALKGLNAMPIKGACQECTDADIKAAIQYMVPQ